MEFYLLENGEISGPFTREFLSAQIERGALNSAQMAQATGDRYWTPLARVLEAPEGEGQSAGSVSLNGLGAEIPDGQAEEEPARPLDGRMVLEWGYGHLRHAFETQPLAAGGVALLAGCLFYFIALFPVLLWLPWFLGTLMASLVLIRTGKFAPGGGMMGAAVVVPLVLVLSFGGAAPTKRPPLPDAAPMETRAPAPAIWERPERESVKMPELVPVAPPATQESRSTQVALPVRPKAAPALEGR